MRGVKWSILPVLLILAGCGAPEHGTVTAKRYEPPREYLMFISVPSGQTCTGTGTSRICTTNYIQVPYWVNDGADWKLKIKDGKKEGWAYVTQPTFETLKVGMYYDRKTNQGYLHDPNNYERPR